jgi:hypothetical protein
MEYYGRSVVPVILLDFFNLRGGGPVGLWRVSYNVQPNQKTPGLISISVENKNLRIFFICLVIFYQCIV